MLTTERDVEILRFIGEFGFCEMPQIEDRFNLKKPRSYKVINRLIKAGLLLHEYILHNKHGIYRLTREGAEFTDLPRLKFVSLASYIHQVTVVDVHLKLRQKYPDAEWMGERRLRQENIDDNRFKRLEHTADGMLIFPDSKQIAIEVELTMKGKDRLDKIIRNYARDNYIDGVWYYCTPEIVNRVKKVAEDWGNIVNVYNLMELGIIHRQPIV